MKLNINFDRIDSIFKVAEAAGRNQLFEYENYAMLTAIGAESVPRTRLWLPGARLPNKDIESFPGQKVVLKIVSPYIVHKSDVEGVRVIEKTTGTVRSGCRRMFDETTDLYSTYLETKPHYCPERYQGLFGKELRKAVASDIHGVLICEYLPPDSMAFGNELLVSLRLTREFGMVITAGLGGTDTELYAGRFKAGQAVVSASTELISGEAFLGLFQHTIAYEKLGGLNRGGKRLVSDFQLLECFGAYIALGRRYSPLNADAPFVIEEFEVNPFAFSEYQMVPLDGLCRFGKPGSILPHRSVERIEKLLRPESIAIMGVSSSKVNFGRAILRNLLAFDYPKAQVRIINPSASEIDGIACVKDLEELGRTDLLVVAVDAHQAADIIDQVVESDSAQSVIVISGGMGETEESRDRAKKVMAKIRSAHERDGGGPVFLGGNCMGAISEPGRVDTFFVPDNVLPKNREGKNRNLALISQSGAFALTRMLRLVNGDPVYNITVGNQMDLTIGDFANYMADDERIHVIAIYAEGFNDLDGLHLCKGIRKAVLKGKEVLVYKAGRTPEGKLATSGHTASVAGDYSVCVSCLTQAGALVSETFDEFDSLINMACALHDKQVNGNQVAGLSPAGFEAVGMADYLLAHDSQLSLAQLGEETLATMEEKLENNRLTGIIDVRNPMDVTPAANDKLCAQLIECLAADPMVHSVVVSYCTFSPGTLDTPDPDTPKGYRETQNSFGNLLVGLCGSLEKPVVVFNDADNVHRPLNDKLEAAGVPVFSNCGRAMATLSRYTNYRLGLTRLRAEKRK
jgi:acyl-CoA synthetase (NDP forming)